MKGPSSRVNLIFGHTVEIVFWILDPDTSWHTPPEPKRSLTLVTMKTAIYLNLLGIMALEICLPTNPITSFLPYIGFLKKTLYFLKKSKKGFGGRSAFGLNGATHS